MSIISLILFSLIRIAQGILIFEKYLIRYFMSVISFSSYTISTFVKLPFIAENK